MPERSLPGWIFSPDEEEGEKGIAPKTETSVGGDPPLLHLLPQLRAFLELKDPDRVDRAMELLVNCQSEDELFADLQAQYGDIDVEDVEKVVPQSTVNEPNSGKSESTQRSTSASSSRIPVPKASRKSKQDKSSDLEDFIVPDSEEEEEVSDEEEEDSFEIINPIPTRSKGRSRSPRRAPGPQIVCKYGRACYRKNPVHFQEFAHPWLPGGGPP